MGAISTTLSTILFFLLLFPPTADLQPISSSFPSNAITYNFPSFNSSTSFTYFTFSNSSSLGGGALQVTPDQTANNYYLAEKSGRIIFNQPFTVWSKNSTSAVVASFETSFTACVYPVNASSRSLTSGFSIDLGGGLASFIGPAPDAAPPSDAGAFLGLTTDSLNGDPSNHFVAIELDTHKQFFDPDGNHIGLDINSVISDKNESLTPLGIEIASADASKSLNVWIDYDGSNRSIRVYVDYKVLLPRSYFGFPAATGDGFQLHVITSWNLMVERLPEPPEFYGPAGHQESRWKSAVVVGVPTAAAVVIVGLVLGRWMRRRREKEGDDRQVLAGTLRNLPGTPKEFEFRALRRATNNFDQRLKLGQGGFGIVYKGVIPAAGAGEEAHVAVKKFSRGNINGQDDFLKELTIINRLRHKHLVPLLGWCHKNGVLLLVYDYMPNGSLDQHLFSATDRPLLSWDYRYTIIAGVAAALHYLHNEYNQTVIHRDLKASNIMLNDSFSPRLGDFGLARTLEANKASYTEVELGGVPGTMGYIAPECFLTNKATRESDVFAFGAVVLEVVCGRRPRCDIAGFHFLADWAWKLHREGTILDAVDPRLEGAYAAEDAERLLLLGLACSHPIPAERPKTAAIVQILSRSMALPDVPPFKPAFVWPSMPTNGEGDSGSDEEYTTETEMEPEGRIEIVLSEANQ